MAEPTAANIFRSPGKLIASPSGYDPDNNHGGVVLGAITGLWLDMGLRHEPVYFDELGKAGEVITFADEPLVMVSLRSRDDDALERVLPNHAASITTIGGDPTFLSKTKSLSLLFAPDDPDAPGFILLNAVPMARTEELGLRFSILREQNLYVTFLGLPTSSSSMTSGRVGKTASIL